MPQGYDTRQATQDPNSQNGNVNVPARQIGSFGVGSPRGGDMSAVGNDARVLAEALKMGAPKLDGFIAQREEEDRIAGEMRYAEGKTEEEMNKAGVNRATMEGFRGLKAKTAANEWFAVQAQSIDSQWSTRPTAEYRDHLQSQFSDLTKDIDPSDTYTRKLVGSMAGEMFTKLVSQQVLANSSWAKGETLSSFSNLVVSEAKTGGVDAVKDITDNAEHLMPGANPDERREASLRAVRETLKEGQSTVLAALGGMDGIRKMGATEAELESITNAMKEGQTKNETTYMSEIGQRTNNIMLDLKQSGDVKSATDQLKELQGDYNLRPEFIRSMYNQVQAYDFDMKLTSQETAKLYSPEYLDDMEKLSKDAKFGALDNEGLKKQVDLIAAKWELTPDIVKKNYELAQAGRQNFIAQQDQLVQERAKQVLNQQELDRKSTALLNSNFNGMYADEPKTVQNAFNLKRNSLAKAVMSDPRYNTDDERMDAMVKQHVDFLRGVPNVDEQVKREFAAAGQGTPVDDKGMLRADVQQAFAYMSAMRDAGMSERTIKEYVGPGYDYLATAIDVGTGVNDPKTALTSAWKMMENKDNGVTPRTDPVAAKIAYESEKSKYFDNLEPSMISAWLGAENGSQFNEVLSFQVKEAASNSQEMDAYMSSRIRVLSEMNPSMKQEAVIALAKKDMAKFEYVLGNMVRPVGTKTLSQAMGVDDVPGALVSNAALLTYLRDKGDKLWPEGTEERNWWTVVKDAGSDAKNAMFFQQEKVAAMLGADNIKPFGGDSVADNVGNLFNMGQVFSEKNQMLDKKIPMVDIQTLSNGNLLIQLYHNEDRERSVGTPIIVPAREVGDYYKAQRRAAFLDRNLKR